VSNVVEANAEGDVEHLAVAVAKFLHGCSNAALGKVCERCEPRVAFEAAAEVGFADAGFHRQIG